MKSSIILLASMLALFFAAQMSRGAEQRSFWAAKGITVEDLQPLRPTLQLLHP